jgi:hypothetical protein
VERSEILSLRLLNQQLEAPFVKDAAALASWFGAIQSQEYASSRDTIGVRLPGLSDGDVLQAIDNKTIVRTWALRGTLQLVARDDLRWMVSITAAANLRRAAARYREFGLTPQVLEKAGDIIARQLSGGKQLTRKELAEALKSKGIEAGGLRGTFIIYQAVGEQLICLSSLRGKQETYTLLDEWIPQKSPLSREEALAILAKKYFQSHGPATIADYAWWAGISLTEAGKSMESIRKSLEQVISGEKTYYFFPGNTSIAPKSIHLLPAFDEYLLGYKDRSLVLDSGQASKVISVNGIFRPVILIDGRVAGGYRKLSAGNSIKIELQPFAALVKSQLRDIEHCAQQLASFSGKKPALSVAGYPGLP